MKHDHRTLYNKINKKPKIVIVDTGLVLAWHKVLDLISIPKSKKN